MDYKEALNSDVFETIMKRALIERYTDEVNDLTDSSEDEPLSESLAKKIRRTIRKVGRKEQLTCFGKFALKSTTIILMVLGVSFGILMTQPKVYAAVCDVVRTVFEDHDSYSSGIDSSNMDGKTFDNNIVPSYIPEGYKLRQAFYGDYNVDLIYENIDNMDIRYGYGTKDGTEISINNERIDFSEITINGITFYVYEAMIDNDYSNVIWYNSNYVFMLKSQLSVEEIVKIAESVSEVQ